MADLLRRRGKELREQVIAGIGVALTSPILGAVAVAIKIEGSLDRRARGPVFFRETRVSRGREIQMLKFRTLDRSALASLGSGPSHIKAMETDHTTRVGAVLQRWYLDELPQLLNIVRGDMFLIGTRPYPVELYEAELAEGITRKRDMPGGLIGTVQANKGKSFDPVEADAAYWDAFRHLSAWQMLRLDAAIVWRSARVVLEHRGL
jgi:lipopolysaccharide/colanic/teichoic acid biosynthesis glycosyltransferase